MRMGQDSRSNILLESGTNELEIIEFVIGENVYGINVAKVREIIRYPEAVIPVPNAHTSLEGIVDLRGQVVPIINLQTHLGSSREMDKASSYVIVSEFNGSMVGFCVKSVVGIQRLSWKQIEPPKGMIASGEGSVVAIVKLEDRMILLLDFEKLTSDIDPNGGMKTESERVLHNEDYAIDRSSQTIYIVEDSNYIQKIIAHNLQKAGYQVITASNGLMAWEYLTKVVSDENFKKIEDHVNIIITDIEMPQMDGLHLIRNIKNNENMKSIPCIVFSSLINKEMAMKCKAVGADAQMGKPDLGRLVELIDDIVAGKPVGA